MAQRVDSPIQSVFPIFGSIKACIFTPQGFLMEHVFQMINNKKKYFFDMSSLYNPKLTSEGGQEADEIQPQRNVA